MKKNILLIATILLTIFNANAQVAPQAIGLRFGGGNFGSGAEINYLHGIGETNRAEIGLGFNALNGSSYLSFAGIYQWVFDLEEGFNWFLGPGAQLLFIQNSGAILVGGEIGIAYNFNTNLALPLCLELDTRPMINLGEGNGVGWGIRLSAHYTF
jgi:hypothetical protein